MSDPLLLPLRPSPWLAALSLVLFLLLSLALLMADLPWGWRLPLSLIAAVGALHLLVGHGLRRGPFAVTAVEWLGEGRWRLTVGGRRLEARRLERGLVHHRVVAVPFAAGGRRYSLLLTAEAVEAEPMRRLRARLLLG